MTDIRQMALPLYEAEGAAGAQAERQKQERQLRCELYHDSFQNFKKYQIPKAQLVIADAPYNVGGKARIYPQYTAGFYQEELRTGAQGEYADSWGDGVCARILPRPAAEVQKRRTV